MTLSKIKLAVTIACSLFVVFCLFLADGPDASNYMLGASVVMWITWIVITAINLVQERS